MDYPSNEEIEKELMRVMFEVPEMKRVECEGVGDNNGFYTFTPKTDAQRFLQVKNLISQTRLSDLDAIISYLESEEVAQKTEDEPENNGYASAVRDLVSYLTSLKENKV